jgi:hypothetical protein
MARAMGRGRPDLRYDVNHDGRVNARDLLIVVRAMGTSC